MYFQVLSYCRNSYKLGEIPWRPPDEHSAVNEHGPRFSSFSMKLSEMLDHRECSRAAGADCGRFSSLSRRNAILVLLIFRFLETF